MNISIFEKIGLPKSAEDKKQLAKLSKVGHKVVECNDIKTLYRFITQFGWSPSIFKHSREKSNFLYADFLVLDIDEGLSIEQALERIEKLNLYSICLPTASHTTKHNKFRLIFPTNARVTDEATFVYNMNKLKELFPEADPSCITDTARFYFPCQKNDDGFMYNGELYSIKVPELAPKDILRSRTTKIPVDLKNVLESIYGGDRDVVPLCVVKFLKYAHTGLPGEWVLTLNAFVFSLALQGVDINDIYAIIRDVAPEDLDDRDEKTIDTAYEDGLKQKEINEQGNKVS